MTTAARVSVRPAVLVGAALGLLAVGAGAAYVGIRVTRPAPEAAGEPPGIAGSDRAAAPREEDPASPPAVSSPRPDVAVPLGKEGAARGGIVVTTVTRGAAADGLRAPGVVEPNAYKRVAVTPIVSGRITRVTAALGEQVRRGQTIAEIFSPELADSQTRYISARAELQAYDLELARTEKLVGIGAASRQELERIQAEHAARRAGLQSAAARLRLLGLTDSGIVALDAHKPPEATVRVPAPIAGVVTERSANVGLNVDRATTLFTVIDLSSVWVVADVYEKDFSRVRVGTPARVVTTAYPDLTLIGQVSYIDPQVSAETRTARIRVEVANTRGNLRLGMFAEVILDGEASGRPMIPRSAVQHVGDRTVIYLVDPQKEGEFIERDVRLGPAAGDQVSVLAGVQPGDVIVSEGSFHLRAERERLGGRPGAAPSTGDAGQRSDPSPQTATITVGEQGYDPAKLTLRVGRPARLTFVRTSDKTCATEVTFPSLKITRALPLNAPVVIDFTPTRPGEVAFACGMNMVKGIVVVE